MIVPVVSVAAADPPNAQSAQPTATVNAANGPPTMVSMPNPAAAITSKPATVDDVPIRCTTIGLSIGPATASSDAGNDNSPAWRGDRPSTNCRYWLIRMNDPNETNTFCTLLANATLNAALRNRVRSSIGSASVCWRRVKTAASPSPATMAATDTKLSPS